MAIRSNRISLTLLFCLLFFHTGFLTAGLIPVHEKTEKRVEVPRKVKKAKKKQKKNSLGIENIDFISILFFQFIFSITGLILLGIGAPLSIAALWITGLVILSLVCIFSIFGIFNISTENGNFGGGLRGFFSAMGFLFIILTLILIYLTLGLVFLIWGLIAAMPVLWIAGILTFLVIASVIAMISKI